MGNTIKTLEAGDITRKALSILHNKLVFIKNINKQYDGKFARSGAKNGGKLEIRLPNQFTVRTGPVMNVQDVVEETTQFVIATQKGVDINFSSVELTLSLDDFAERILEPAMARLAADVENTVIKALYPAVYNFQNTTFGTKPVLADVLAARAMLAKGLAPTGQRVFLTESLAANAIMTDAKALFHASDEIEKQFTEGKIGRMSGFNFFETEMIPTHVNGSRDDTTPICNTSTGITSGDASITTTGADGTMCVGDVFTIADVFAVNPETKEQYAHLQQFAILEAHTNDATDIWEVTPTPVTSGAKQNVKLVDAGASKAIVNAAAGGSGTASTGFVNSLAFHRDAFSFVSADLEMPKGADMAARKVYDGISMRLWRDGDITNDQFPCRLDVLFGQKALRPEWAVRVCS